MLASSASFINCVNGINGDSPTEITFSDVQNIVATLVDNNAYTILDEIPGEDRFGTAPVRDAFYALTSSKIIPELENMDRFIPKAQYPSSMRGLPSEWGSCSNLRFLVSSIGSVFPNASGLGANVYNTFCVGLEAYAYIYQDGYNAEFIHRPPIFSGPLAQNATCGYKMASAQQILNDLWVLNLRSTKA